jgi:hypothetical protein
MFRIRKVKFQRFRDVSLHECVGIIGVYIVWDQNSNLIPTYIGKGNLFDRLDSHHSKFKPPLDGYVAILGEVGDSKAGQHAEMLEAMLLFAADETNRLSKNNRQGGRFAKTKKQLRRHSIVRALITGYDPFSPPRFRRLLSGNKKYFRAFVGDNGSLEIEHKFQCLRGTRSSFI